MVDAVLEARWQHFARYNSARSLLLVVSYNHPKEPFSSVTGRVSENGDSTVNSSWW